MRGVTLRLPPPFVLYPLQLSLLGMEARHKWFGSKWMDQLRGSPPGAGGQAGLNLLVAERRQVAYTLPHW